MTVTLNIPDSFIGDWHPAWEDWTVVYEPDHRETLHYEETGEAPVIREALDATTGVSLRAHGTADEYARKPVAIAVCDQGSDAGNPQVALSGLLMPIRLAK